MEKRDKCLRTPDLLTQEDFDKDEDPQDELMTSPEERLLLSDEFELGKAVSKLRFPK